MDDVAVGAGVSRALVYDYFESKKKLLRAVQRTALDDWFSSSEAVIADAESAREALSAWMTFSLAESDRHRLARVIFAADAVEATGAWDDWREELRHEWIARLTRLIERGIANREFRADLDPAAAALALRGMQVGVTQQVLDVSTTTEVSNERQIAAAIDLMIASLAA